MAFLNDTKTRILELLGGESLETLDPDDYQEKITAFEGALQKHRRTLSDQLERIFPQAHRNNEEKREIAVWYGWAQIFMDVLQQHFERYNKWEEYLLMLRYNGLQDVRLRHRALLARWYGYIVGLLLNDTGFLDKLNEIISGQDVERSYLAFAGVWQQDSSSSVDTMPRDFPARPIEDLGLTPHQLVRVYQLLRLIVRNEQLLLYLSLAEENLDPSTLNLISKSIARANTIMPMPSAGYPRNTSSSGIRMTHMSPNAVMSAGSSKTIPAFLNYWIWWNQFSRIIFSATMPDSMMPSSGSSPT
jgi:hypothetical protein